MNTSFDPARRFVRFFLLLIPLGLFPADGFAAPRLAHIFQDNLVLQRDATVPVWGWAEPGAEAVVAFAGQSVKAVAGADGRWQAALAPMPASNEGRVLSVRVGETVLERKNVLVGEVWVAAGQSNMNHSGPDRDTGVYPAHVSPAGALPDIRMTEFGWGVSLEPLSDVDPAGRGAKPWTTMAALVPGQSGGIPVFFARRLRDELQVPVGIVRVAVSGTNQAAWMARETLEQFPGGGGHKDFYQESLAEREASLGKSAGAIKSWAQFKAAEDAWRETTPGQWPGRALGLTLSHYPSALYNTRVHPLAPFAIRGVIWHQGEAGPGGPYGERLVAMTRQWRAAFGQDFHFIWGTLSRHSLAQPPLLPTASYFYRSGTNNSIRQARQVFGEDPKVEYVELYDLGNHDTHFNQKAEAGRRMALAALQQAYGRPQLFTGPRLAGLKIEGARAVATFELAGDGLVYRPSIEGISGVLIKGKSGPDRWATVTVVDPRTLEIAHPDGMEIVGVGYAVASNPHETLFNSAGLPATPFNRDLGRVPHSGQEGGPRMIEPAGGGASGSLSLVHVRREGYVFQVIPKDAAAGAVMKVRALAPGEWNGVEVRAGGQRLEAEPVEQDGRHFIVFDAPADRSWVIVAAPGQAAALEKINRY